MDGSSVRGTTLRGLAEAARDTLGDEATDTLLASVSPSLREALDQTEGGDDRWFSHATHMELMGRIEASRSGAATLVADRAIARRLRGMVSTLVPKLSPSCIAERLDAIVAAHADWVRLELRERTLVSARFRAELGARMDAASTDWLTGMTRGALMAAGAPNARAVLVLDGDGRSGDLRVEWA